MSARIPHMGPSRKAARAVAPHYPGSPSATSWFRRVRNVLLWALLVAAVSALIGIIALKTGGAALPAGMTLGKYLLQAAGHGLLEGALYGGLFEALGAREAKKLYSTLAKTAVTLPKAEIVDEKEIRINVDRSKKEQSTKVAAGTPPNHDQ